MKLQDLPQLEGWTSLPDAARIMKITRQRIHQLVDKGRFKTASRIGNFAIVRTAEVHKVKAEMLAERAEEETDGSNV
jgi:Arc/MetJ-type ribon-helix-helix transcriptional regulator